MKSCAVRSCNSQNDPNRMYHKFPVDSSKRKEWFHILGLKKNDNRSSLFVCGKHFRFKDYCSGGKRLRPEAVPTIRLKPNSNKKNSSIVKVSKVSAINKIVSPKKLLTNRKPSLTGGRNLNNNGTPLKPSTLRRSDCCENPTKTLKTTLKEAIPKKSKTSTTTKNKVQTNCKSDLEEMKQIVRNKALNELSSRASSTESRKKPKVVTVKSNKLRSTAAFPLIVEENSLELSESEHCGMDTSRDNPSVLNIRINPITSTPNENATKSETKQNVCIEDNPVFSNTFIIQSHEILESRPETLTTLTPVENLSISETKDNTSLEKPKTLMTKVNPEVSESRSNSSLENEQDNQNESIKAEQQNKLEVSMPETEVVDKLQVKEPSSDLVSNSSKYKNKYAKDKPVSKNTTTVNKKAEETVENYRTKRQRTKRRRLISTDSESCDKDCVSLTKRVCSNSRQSASSYKRSSSHSSIVNIENTLKEMQKKIDQLEKKSILDEKRIEAFKNALIKQRNHDIKVIMDEKENELLLRMELLYLDYDPQKICRLCLIQVENRESLTSLFLPQENHTLLSMIQNTINIQIKYDEKMPMGICEECMIQIQRIDWMKRKSQRSNSLIQKFTLKRKGKINTSTAATTNENSSEEDKQPNEDTFEEENLSEVKIEDVFSLGESEIIDIKQEPESEEEYTIITDEYVEFENFKREKDKPRKCQDCRTMFTSNWSWTRHSKWCQRVFQCSECSKCFWNSELFSKHKQHKYACHSKESYRTCDKCQVIFRWKYQYLFHLATGICLFNDQDELS